MCDLMCGSEVPRRKFGSTVLEYRYYLENMILTMRGARAFGKVEVLLGLWPVKYAPV